MPSSSGREDPFLAFLVEGNLMSRMRIALLAVRFNLFGYFHAALRQTLNADQCSHRDLSIVWRWLEPDAKVLSLLDDW